MRNRGALISGIVRAVFRAIRIILPQIDFLRVYWFAIKDGNTIVKLRPQSFSDYCNNSRGTINIIEESEKRTVYEPPYYPEREGHEHSFLSPPIYIAELYNVLVHGGTGLLIAGDNALTDICEEDTNNRVKYAAGPIRRGSKKAFYVEVTHDIDEIEYAVSLCGLSADNYYHLTFEILSRFEYIRQYVEQRRIPVLLDDSVKEHDQYEKLVKTVIGSNSIIYVPKYKRILCKKLIYPSMNTWMPMNVNKRNDYKLSDNIIAESALINIRKSADTLRNSRTDLKLFVSRKSQIQSRLENENEIVDLFRNNGYRIICTEEFSYEEQVRLFSSASCIVGASGAALTNLVYCNAGTVVGCIIPKEYRFCIYSSIAHMTGCKILFLNAKVVRHGDAISKDLYIVNLSECKNYIKALDTLLMDS